jgi:pimeloyl-ACP methyl ester carboxylesterase
MIGRMRAFFLIAMLAFATVAAADSEQIYRYSTTAVQQSTPAILLVPDVFENRHVFDLNGHGLAPYLVKAGYEVFAMDWRGRDFDAMVTDDLPAAVKEVHETTGRPVCLIAHGIGGTAALAYAVNVKPGTKPFIKPGTAMAYASNAKPGVLRGIVAIGTPGRFLLGNRIFDAFVKAEKLLPENEPLDPKLGIAVKAPIPGTELSMLDVLLTNDPNFDPEVRAAYYEQALNPLPRPLAGQLAGWIESKKTLSVDGKTDYHAELSKVKTATLFLCGKVDNVADPVESMAAEKAIGSSDKSLHIFSEIGGTKRNYGHVGLLLGPRVEKEIFPHLLEWLRERPV